MSANQPTVSRTYYPSPIDETVRSLRILWVLAVLTTHIFDLILSNAGGQGGAFLHAAAFVVRGFLTQQTIGRFSFIKAFVLIALLGGAIEIAQGLFTLHRQPEWIDWFMDLGAGDVGLVLGMLVSKLRRTVADS